MECQNVLQSLSSFIDGELDNSEAVHINSHIEHCSVCREQWQLLLGVTSLLQSLPEVMPDPEFHSRLRSKLTKFSPPAVHCSVLPDLNAQRHNDILENEQYDNLKLLLKKDIIQFPEQSEVNNHIENLPTVKAVPSVSLWRNFTNAPWSKLTASAVLLVLVFGITGLWYTNKLDLKNGPSAQIYSISDSNFSSNQISKDGRATPDNHVFSDSTDVYGADKKENEDQTGEIAGEASIDNSQVNDVKPLVIKPDRQSSTKQLSSNSPKNDDTVEDISAGRVESNTPPSRDNSDPTVGQRRDLPAALTLPQDSEQNIASDNFSLKASVNPNEINSEPAAQKVAAEKPRSMTMQINVQNNENTTEQILILSKNKKATVRVENNMIFIDVPAENYDDLVEQIRSLGEVLSQKAMTSDVSTAEESKSLIVQINEQKSGK